MRHHLITRAEATQATVDKFKYAPFNWGSTDCAHLVAYHLVQMGHDDPLAGVKSYGTYRGARKAMKAAGVATLPSYFDQRFERIAPAEALVGDVIALPGPKEDDPDWVALGLVVGHGRVLAFAPVDTAGNSFCLWSDGSGIALSTHAWRVVPNNAPVQVQAEEVL